MAAGQHQALKVVDLHAMTEPVLPDVDRLHAALMGSSVNIGLLLLYDRWTIMILRSAFLGVRHFDKFQKSLEVPKQTLSLRLKELIKSGILRAQPQISVSSRLQYRLTKKGLALYPMLLMSWVWQRRWGPGVMPLPRRLIHKTCGTRFVPKCFCAECQHEAGLRRIEFIASQPKKALPPVRRARRLTDIKAGAVGAAQDKQRLALGLAIDRWSILIISAVILGCHQFDQLQKVLGLGPSLLADRLAKLCECGLLLRQPDLHDGRRFVYLLSPPSEDLFPLITTLGRWVSEHHSKASSSILLRHRDCGHPFRADVVCNQCRQVLRPQDVQFEF